MPKKYVMSTIPDQDGDYEIEYTDPSSDWFDRTACITSHRNLSQLGTCGAWQSLNRNMIFGDGDEPSSPYKSIYEESPYKSIYEEYMHIYKQFGFPARLARFVRS